VVVGPLRVGSTLEVGWGNKVVFTSYSLEDKCLHAQEENDCRGKVKYYELMYYYYYCRRSHRLTAHIMQKLHRTQ